MTPAETMRRFGHLLTPFEQSEILEYQQIYFVGNNLKDKIKGIPHTPLNNGYDDERGDYRITMGDHLEYRYEVLAVLGRGSFGQVLRVFDHKKDMVVALKIIRNKKRFHHQALVEVKILEHLMGRDREHKSNIVRVHGYFYFRNHLMLTFEPLSLNLYEFIKNNNFKGLSLSLIRRFAIQLLQSLKFLKSERIIHCDLKPENVLLKAPNKSTIKLIDFGSSCFEDERVYTYIQSRFYRSPEVILGLPYDIAIDMWSFGCILAELYTGYPLFPGENEVEQFQCMMEVLGLPPKRLVQECTRKKTFFDMQTGKPLLTPNTRGKIRQPGSKDISSATRCNDPAFLSFLRRCLRWDPKVRMTPEKAFEHPFITGIKPEGHSFSSTSSSTNGTPTHHSSHSHSHSHASPHRASGGGGGGGSHPGSGQQSSRGDKVQAKVASGENTTRSSGMQPHPPSAGPSMPVTARHTPAADGDHHDPPSISKSGGGGSTNRKPSSRAQPYIQAQQQQQQHTPSSASSSHQHARHPSISNSSTSSNKPLFPPIAASQSKNSNGGGGSHPGSATNSGHTTARQHQPLHIQQQQQAQG